MQVTIAISRLFILLCYGTIFLKNWPPPVFSSSRNARWGQSPGQSPGMSGFAVYQVEMNCAENRNWPMMVNSYLSTAGPQPHPPRLDIH